MKNLEQIFKNKFDCYTIVDNGNGILEEQIAMTKEQFVEVVKSLLPVSSLQLKEKHKTDIEKLEIDLLELEQDEDFGLSDNSEWSRQLGIIEGKLTILNYL